MKKLLIPAVFFLYTGRSRLLPRALRSSPLGSRTQVRSPRGSSAKPARLCDNAPEISPLAYGACRWAEAQQAGGSVCCAACTTYGDTVLSQRSRRLVICLPSIAPSGAAEGPYHRFAPRSTLHSASRPPILSPPVATPIGFIAALQQVNSPFPPYLSVPIRTPTSLHVAARSAPAARRALFFSFRLLYY